VAVPYVWYAAYGSNLCRERFETYLTGGCPPGATLVQPGCRDASLPVDVGTVTIPFPLYFAERSVRWEGSGVAFVGAPRPGTGIALGRRYLITAEQFTDMIAQENHLDPDSARLLDLDRVAQEGDHAFSDARYGRVVHVGEVDGLPVLTFTAPHLSGWAAPTPPTVPYLRLIATGLAEAYGMDAPDAARYLAAAPGARGRLDPVALAEALVG
jgi:hypothetical protein